MTTTPASTTVQTAAASLIDSMRSDAEAAVANVDKALAAPDGRGAVERLVGGFYKLLDIQGTRVMRLWTAINIAIATEGQAGGVTPKTMELRDRVERLLVYWTALAQGFAMYVRPATDAERGKAVEVGIAPAVMVLAVTGAVAVVVIAVSVTGVAWAVVHYAQAQNLSDELDLIEKDPAMAGALARLHDSRAADQGAGGVSTGALVAGGVGLAAAVGFAIWLTRGGR